MTTKRRLDVAVLGAAGLVGRALVPRLGHHELRLLDRRADRTRGIRRQDVRRLRSLTRALQGCDVVVDLAAAARADSPWSAVYRNNIRSVWTVLEAARLAGVPRVVHASSNHVATGYETDAPWAAVVTGDHGGLDAEELPRLPTTVPPRPVSAYGAGKVFAEAACRWYTEAHGLSTVCLRIGTVLEPDRPRTSRHYATWLSHADLAGYVDAAALAPASLGHAVVWGVSANRWRMWETVPNALGYVPTSDAEEFR